MQFKWAMSISQLRLKASDSVHAPLMLLSENTTAYACSMWCSSRRGNKIVQSSVHAAFQRIMTNRHAHHRTADAERELT
jgi:hypothetical protein